MQQVEQEREPLARTQQQTRHWQQVIEHAETFRHLLGDNLDQLSFEERQAVAQCLIRTVVVTGEHVDIAYVLPFEGAPQAAEGPGSTPEGPPGHVYRLRLAHFDLPALAVQLGEVGHTVDVCVEERGHQGDLAGPEAWRADLIAHLSEHERLWQGRQRLPGEPRGTGLGFQPGHELVMDAERFEPAGPWHAFDGRCPPHARLDKGPPRREVHDLSRADAQHGMHASLDEEGEMGVGTQAPIRHQHIPGC